MKLYSSQEVQLFKRLNTPSKVQDYLNSLKFNFEKNGETCMSPRFVIKNKTAHCMEGAMLAAAILEFHGYKPWVIDLRSIKPGDDDHVVAVFKQFSYYGAISKTNHAVLRYREPIYKTVRELVLSYFHEYFLKDGRKTLREYSDIFDLSFFDKIGNLHPLPNPPPSLHRGEGIRQDWRTSEENIFEIPAALDKIKHYKILSSAQIKNLRKADKIEIKAGEMVEWRK
jgi:hypothetical protein